MDAITLLTKFILFSLLFYWSYGKNMAIVTPADMKKFRADNYVIPIDELSDLNTTTKEAIDILNRIKALDVKGENMLVVIPDNGVICATQVRHRIEKMISPQTKELVDNCVAIHLDDRSLELNANQLSCINEILDSADRDLEAMKQNIEECKLFV